MIRCLFPNQPFPPFPDYPNSQPFLIHSLTFLMNLADPKTLKRFYRHWLVYCREYEGRTIPPLPYKKYRKKYFHWSVWPCM